jgi:hypothetical protein
MTVIFMLLMFGLFLGIDAARTNADTRRARHAEDFRIATGYTTPGYEFLGALAQDGGKPIKKV